MKHHAAVPNCPVRTTWDLISMESILQAKDVVREFLLKEDVAELVVEISIVIVDNLQDSTFCAKRVTKIVVELMPGEFYRPTFQVVPI